MTFLIGRKIALGYLLSVLVLVAIGVFAERNFRAASEDANWVTHTVEVLLNLESLRGSLRESQDDARGFFVTGDPDLSEDFRVIGQKIDGSVAQLLILTHDNPLQQERLQRLKPLIAARREASRHLMEGRATTALTDAAAAERVENGKHLTEQVESIIQELISEEQNLLHERDLRAREVANWASGFIFYGTLGSIVLIAMAGLAISRSIVRPLARLSSGAKAFGEGNYSERVDVRTSDEVGQVAEVFNRMAEQVQERQRAMTEQDWLKTRMVSLLRVVQGQRNLQVVGTRVLSELSASLNFPYLTFYDRMEGETSWKLLAAFGTDKAKAEVAANEGLVGQCGAEGRRLVVDPVPDQYVVESSLGSAKARVLILQPILVEGRTKGVIELAAFRRPTELHFALLDQLGESLGAKMTSIEASIRTEELLTQARSLTETLKQNELDLQEKNAELETQADELRRSETLLQQQQEELRESNEELHQTNEELRQTTEEMEEKANLLEEQKMAIQRANLELEQARVRLERQAAQLESTSRYKSDFLANMSHELRTPLNSLLILSKMLADNPTQNLTDKQVQYAKTIHGSGQDLLELINDILDLSKIEAGKVELEIEEVSLQEISQFAEQTFRPVADQKKIGFSLSLDPSLPKAISTDRRRLQQILKNLLANAFKFTERGSVDLGISAVLGSQEAGRPGVFNSQPGIAFSVTDTGIGISPEKQQVIFEAFRQADAGTSRRFGGTGLGLSISRELARRLGGSLEVESEPGQGSTFTLVVPLASRPLLPNPSDAAAAPVRPSRRAPSADRPIEVPIEMEAGAEAVEDDRDKIKPGDRVLLIIEDDKTFARIMMDFAREKNFKPVVARTAAQGMVLAQSIKPSAITLDLQLPDQDGWVVIDWLKHQPSLRHIPVHIISIDEERERSLRLGAVSFLQKPATREALENALSDTVTFLNRPVKELLVVEDDSAARASIVELIGEGDVQTTAVGTGAEALAELAKKHYDCVVLDLGLPDISGTDLLREIHARFKDRAPPVIVYTGKELSREEETELRLNAESIIVKSVRSPERLLDETALFLHRVQAKLPDAKRKLIEQGQKTDPILLGRKVLVVDDDVRNIFAVTSALEAYQMTVLYAESGKDGLEILEKNPDIDVVLMDVMMPEMDGYEAIRRIREKERFRKLPIISVTAKAMKGDREKCLEAGASDYLAKPVDMDKLRSLLRVWLYR